MVAHVGAAIAWCFLYYTARYLTLWKKKSRFYGKNSTCMANMANYI